MSARTRSIFPALLALVAAALPMTPSLAAASTDTIRISYAGLNLSTPAGVAAFYGRIRHAAADYCEPSHLLTGTRVSPQYTRCVSDAIATTVKQIGNPGLTALHASRAGTTSG